MQNFNCFNKNCQNNRIVLCQMCYLEDVNGCIRISIICEIFFEYLDDNNQKLEWKIE